jgi:hypothetical protein
MSHRAESGLRGTRKGAAFAEMAAIRTQKRRRNNGNGRNGNTDTTQDTAEHPICDSAYAAP